LLDEPFGALDAQLKSELQTELAELFENNDLTVVFVTHDIEEAILLGDRVVVLGTLGKIIADVQVPLERPTDMLSAKVDPEFVPLHDHLSESLRESAGS